MEDVYKTEDIYKTWLNLIILGNRIGKPSSNLGVFCSNAFGKSMNSFWATGSISNCDNMFTWEQKM